VSYEASLGLLFLSGDDADGLHPPAHAETSETIWDCPQADGSTVYTNKEHAGCQAITLRPLSVVPDLAPMPTIPRATPDTVRPHDRTPSQHRPSQRPERSVPDWAKDWYAGLAPSGSVQEEVCSLYSEWMHLVLKTRGGFFFGSDPSYGGDITGLNQRGPSYSYYDNSRYLALSKLFGRGFVPVGCI
jgi:hypothetical protein